MAKAKDKTHQPNGQQLSYSWLGTDIFKCRKWWIEPGFTARNLSLLRQSLQKYKFLSFISRSNFYCWLVYLYLFYCCIQSSAICFHLTRFSCCVDQGISLLFLDYFVMIDHTVTKLLILYHRSIWSITNT